MQIKSKNSQIASLELALLVIFAIGLLIAVLITSLQRRIPMSPPIKLDFASITASIPSGRQWVSFDRWKYNKLRNNFVLASTIVQRELTVAFAELTYILTPNTLDPVAHLEKGLNPSSIIIDKGQITRDGIDVLWYSVAQESIAGGIYIAAARLPADRILQIKIFAYRDELLAKQAFDAVMKGLSFGTNQPLEDSLNFVTHLKQKKLPLLIQNETGRSLARIYLVNRTEPVDVKIEKQNIFDGFVVERFSFSSDPAAQPFQCKGFFMMDDPHGAAADTSFESDLSFDTFTWRARRTTTKGAVAAITQIERDDQGLLSHTNLYAEPSSATLRPGPLAVPEILLDTIATEFLNYRAETIYLDIIFIDGKVVPVKLSKVTPEDVDADIEDIAFAVKMQYLNRLDNSHTLYFDKNNNIVTKLETAEVTIVGHRSNARDLINAFPKWTEHIKDILR